MAENAETLEAIRSHILNRELSQRGTYPAEVILEKNYAFLLESGLVFASFQRILQLSMLDRKLQGQHQAAEDTLETSWKLNQTLLQEQILISQLVHLIVSRQQIGTMRKLEYLSPEWQQRLAEYDFHPSLFKSVESEIFSFYGFSKDLESHYSYREFKRFLGEEALDDEFTKRKWFTRFFFWFRPILKPYHRFSTIKSIQQSWEELAGASNQPSICQSDDWVRQSDADWWSLWTWWNPLGVWDEHPIDFARQERKVDKLLVEVELTQKILQAKAQAAELGRWPETLPDLESRICPGERWIYRVSEGGTMSLSLSREPPWLAEHVKRSLPPLEFRTNKLPSQP